MVRPPFPRQHQPMPGRTDAMKPRPDHGEDLYRGCNKLAGKKAVITGGDSGIGRAVAIAYAREGADIVIAYLNEHEDAKETQRLVEEAGRKAVLIAGDIGSSGHCRKIIDTAIKELGTDRHSRQQCRPPSHLQIDRGYFRRGMGAHLPGQYPRDVLSDESSRSAHEGRQRDHQHGIHQCGRTEPHLARLCHDQRRDPELYGRSGATPCGEGHPCERSRSRPDLDFR